MVPHLRLPHHAALRGAVRRFHPDSLRLIYWITAEFMEAQLRAAIATELSSLGRDYGSSASTARSTRSRAGRLARARSELLSVAGCRRAQGFRQSSGHGATAGWYELPIPRSRDDTDSSDT